MIISRIFNMNWRSDGIYVTIVPETLFRELSSEEDSSFARILFLVLYSSAGTYSGWRYMLKKITKRYTHNSVR